MPNTNPKAQAREITDAMNEVRAAYNAAKSKGRTKAKVSTRALYLLTVGACRGFDLPLHAADGSLIYDPRADGVSSNPSKN